MNVVSKEVLAALTDLLVMQFVLTRSGLLHQEVIPAGCHGLGG